MATATEPELNKLLVSAIDACKKAESGDAAEEGRAVDALKVLGKQAVTADLLSKTEAGKRVKKLAKHSCAKIAAAANAAVEAWKECVRQEMASKKQNGDVQQQEEYAAAPSAPEPANDSVVDDRLASGALAGSSSQDLAAQDSRRQSDGFELQHASSNKVVLEPVKCGDDTRDKIRMLLAEALATALGPGVFGDPSIAAVEVEEAMFKQNGGVNAKYKAKYRTLSFNLKDPNNPDLRAKVLTGDIPGDILVNLSAEELGSNDRRQQNDRIRDHMKRECERGQTSQASTDMFQCGKCKQRKCTYYQMQTRSADEPMTTFVTCTNCGNRWKFC